MNKSWLGFMVVGAVWSGALQAQPPEPGTSAAPQAFAFFDQTPTAQIYGLPRAGGYAVLGAQRQQLTLYVSQSSHFLQEDEGGESLLFDGATTRAALVYARGLGRGWQLRATLPFVAHGGGFADSFVDDWHRVFGLPRGDRADAPDDRQVYRYERDGQTRLTVDDSPSGIGDARLALKKRLAGFGDWGLSVAAQLKLPTGDAGSLTGSGGIDLALWGIIGNNQQRASPWRMLAAGGVLYTADGDVLPDMRRNTVGFGWLALGYALTPTLVARAQLYLHTSFYDDTALEALNGTAVQGAFGFDWQFARRSALSLALIEDLNPGVTPDVGLVLGISRAF